MTGKSSEYPGIEDIFNQKESPSGELGKTLPLFSSSPRPIPQSTYLRTQNSLGSWPLNRFLTSQEITAPHNRGEGNLAGPSAMRMTRGFEGPSTWQGRGQNHFAPGIATGLAFILGGQSVDLQSQSTPQKKGNHTTDTGRKDN